MKLTVNLKEILKRLIRLVRTPHNTYGTMNENTYKIDCSLKCYLKYAKKVLFEVSKIEPLTTANIERFIYYLNYIKSNKLKFNYNSNTIIDVNTIWHNNMD